jgi:arylsulfatase A-like enzyme
MKSIAAVRFRWIGLLIGLGLLPSCTRHPDANAYNFILISVDTLRADHLSCYGYGRKTSPNIDRLAAESILFENAISQSAWTLPAHVSMMTGLYGAEHGLLFYDKGGEKDKQSYGTMNDSLPTLAGILKTHGYRTASFNDGGWVDPIFGLNKGFDTYKPEGRYFRANVRKSIKWIRQHKKGRFFLFLHGYDVHQPYNAAPKFNVFHGYSGPQDKNKLIAQHQLIQDITSNEYEFILAQYDACIRRADSALGKLFEFLQTEGLENRTVIILTSDHGEMLLERHGLWGHIYPLYEEILHVPLIVKIPGRRGTSVRTQVPASVSILPTVLDIAGIDDPNARSDYNLMRLFREKDFGFDRILSETGLKTDLRLCRSIRTETWKLVVHTSGDNREPQSELFHLETDPLEQRDRAPDNPSQVHTLFNMFENFRQTFRGKNPEAFLDEKTLERIKSLGYVN